MLRFYNTIEECLEGRGKVNVIFSSGVLQYLPDPYGWLKRFAETDIPWLLIDRMPFIDEDSDRLTVQYVPPSIYHASYPAWFFSRNRFDAEVVQLGYKVEARFKALDAMEIGRFEGVLLVKN